MCATLRKARLTCPCLHFAVQCGGGSGGWPRVSCTCHHGRQGGRRGIRGQRGEFWGQYMAGREAGEAAWGQERRHHPRHQPPSPTYSATKLLLSPPLMNYINKLSLRNVLLGGLPPTTTTHTKYIKPNHSYHKMNPISKFQLRSSSLS